MEPERPLPHLQVPAICLYTEPDQSSPGPHIPLPADSSSTPNMLLKSGLFLLKRIIICIYLQRTLRRWFASALFINPCQIRHVKAPGQRKAC